MKPNGISAHLKRQRKEILQEIKERAKSVFVIAHNKRLAESGEIQVFNKDEAEVNERIDSLIKEYSKKLNETVEGCEDAA